MKINIILRNIFNLATERLGRAPLSFFEKNHVHAIQAGMFDLSCARFNLFTAPHSRLPFIKQELIKEEQGLKSN